MSFFSKILEKLGLGKKDEDKDEPTPAASTTTTTTKPSTPAVKPPAPASTTTKPTAPSVKPATGQTFQYQPIRPAVMPVSEVDVVKKLEGLAAGSGLNWKVSIVDLLKLLDIDSSREARNELAKELGCPPELMSDSAKMNVWLHKTVLRKIAENGGNIPKELLD